MVYEKHPVYSGLPRGSGASPLGPGGDRPPNRGYAPPPKLWLGLRNLVVLLTHCGPN